MGCLCVSTALAPSRIPAILLLVWAALQCHTAAATNATLPPDYGALRLGCALPHCTKTCASMNLLWEALPRLQIAKQEECKLNQVCRAARASQGCDTLSTPLLTPLLLLTGQLQGERQRFRVTGASRTYVSSHSWLEIDYAGLAHNAQARPTAPPSNI